MPRKLRLEYPDAMYDIMSRGDQREDIFLCGVDLLLGEHGIQRGTPAGREEFERHMERRRPEEVDEEALKELHGGCWLGNEAFRHEILGQMEGQSGEEPKGAKTKLRRWMRRTESEDTARAILNVQ